MKSDEIGCCRVWVREDPQAFLLHPEDYGPLLAAWQAGAAFYAGRDCYGDAITVKLGAVVAVSLATPAAMEAAAADAKADKLTQGDE